MKLLKVEKKEDINGIVEEAVGVLSRGGVIVYPTETLYGIGVDARREDAILRLREVKGKKEPILVLVSGLKMAKDWVEFSELGLRLAKEFWPGPLTLVLKAREIVPKILIAGADGLGIRVSSLEIARLLCERLGSAITSTSANLSGGAVLHSAGEIKREFGTKIDLLIDVGRLKPSRGSTVLDLTGKFPRLVREGEISKEILENFIKERIM